MFKASIDLGRINKGMKLKFSIILSDDTKPNTQNTNQVISRFTYNGSEYLRIAPRPFITVDISSTADKGDSWNSNNSVNLNKMGVFVLCKSLEYMISKFRDTNLYYYENKRLKVNKTLSDQYVRTSRVGSKVVRLQHMVIPDEENTEIEYEGVCFMINSYDNFCYLSYTELEYLLSELRGVDMNVLAMQLVQVSQSVNTDEPISELNTGKVILESAAEPDIKSPPIYAKIEQANEIPDL